MRTGLAPYKLIRGIYFAPRDEKNSRNDYEKTRNRKTT